MLEWQDHSRDFSFQILRLVMWLPFFYNKLLHAEDLEEEQRKFYSNHRMGTCSKRSNWWRLSDEYLDINIPSHHSFDSLWPSYAIWWQRIGQHWFTQWLVVWLHHAINTLRPRKMTDISQTTFSNVFSWMKMFEFLFKFHWSLILGVQLIIFQHWFG